MTSQRSLLITAGSLLHNVDVFFAHFPPPARASNKCAGVLRSEFLKKKNGPEEDQSRRCLVSEEGRSPPWSGYERRSRSEAPPLHGCDSLVKIWKAGRPSGGAADLVTHMHSSPLYGLVRVTRNRLEGSHLLPCNCCVRRQRERKVGLWLL